MLIIRNREAVRAWGRVLMTCATSSVEIGASNSSLCCSLIFGIFTDPKKESMMLGDGSFPILLYRVRVRVVMKGFHHFFGVLCEGPVT